MTCPLCHTLLEVKKNEAYHDCQVCGSIVKDKAYYLSAADEKARYEEHNNDVFDLGYQKFTSPITNFILEHYNEKHLGLDFGSGTGPVITHQLLQKGFQINLYDPYFAPFENHLRLRYDYIFSCEVFEHFYQPNVEIKRLTALLKPGGRLIIMTHTFINQKTFNDWYYIKDPTHVFIYTPKSFDFIAKCFNYEIEKLTERFVVLRLFN
jgi:SAM-dependent methyltransferase